MTCQWALLGAEATGRRYGCEAVGKRIERVAIDSRQVIPGSVFFALKGEALDGHQFIGEALARGAIAIVGNARAREWGSAGSLTLIDVAGLQPNPSLDAAGRRVTFLLQKIVWRRCRNLQRIGGRKFPDVQVVGVTGSVGQNFDQRIDLGSFEAAVSHLKKSRESEQRNGACR